MRLAPAKPDEAAHWQSHAACAGPDADDWFPARDELTSPRSERARRICRTSCPVRQRCFTEALAADPDRFGIRAGLSPAERVTIRRRRATRGGVSPVEALWGEAQDLYGRGTDRLRRPAGGTAAVVAALTDGPRYGTQVARAAGYTQPAVSRWLRRLERLGFARIEFEHPPAEYWALTDQGRALAAALADEAKAAAA